VCGGVQGRPALWAIRVPATHHRGHHHRHTPWSELNIGLSMMAILGISTKQSIEFEKLWDSNLKAMELNKFDLAQSL
jgi:hypothetical protein